MCCSTNQAGVLGLVAGTQAALVGATMGIFTGMNPLWGMAFGATYALVNAVALGLLVRLLGQDNANKCQELVMVGAYAFSAALTVVIAIGTMALLGVGLSTLTLLILAVALVASAAIAVSLLSMAGKGRVAC